MSFDGAREISAVGDPFNAGIGRDAINASPSKAMQRSRRNEQRTIH